MTQFIRIKMYIFTNWQKKQHRNKYFSVDKEMAMKLNRK